MDPGTVIGRFYEALAGRDRSALRQLLAPDVEIVYHGQERHFPWAGRFTGPDGLDQFLSAVADDLEIVAAERDEPMPAGDLVLVRTEGTWRVRANGALVQAAMLNLFRVRDDRIVGYEVYADTAAFLEALQR